MPKRASNLYEKCFSKEALYHAYLVARKGKRSNVACFKFEAGLGAELDSLHQELAASTYKPREMIKFNVFEPKKRTIHAPQFRDLVVQHAIYKVIYPIFDPSFIDHSFACRKGKGTHKASSYTQKSMQKHEGDAYYAKLDIRKFFYRIDRDILRKLFEKKIKDDKMLNIMCMFTKMEGDKGIPIGNLLSQLYSLIYLNPLDHYVKRELKIKNYVRYVDDFIAIGLTIEKTKEFKHKCEAFVQENLGLELSHWTIAKIKNGINFVGYRTWRTTKFVRKHSVYKFKKAVKKGDITAITSLLAHASHSSTIVFYSRFLQQNNMLNKLPKRSKILCQNFTNTNQR